MATDTITIFPDPLPPKCGDHAHCDGYGRPIDPKTGLAFVCCEYTGLRTEEAPDCFCCGKPKEYLKGLGWLCVTENCNPNLQESMCHFCEKSLEAHRDKLIPGCHQCKNFKGASAA